MHIFVVVEAVVVLHTLSQLTQLLAVEAVLVGQKEVSGLAQILFTIIEELDILIILLTALIMLLGKYTEQITGTVLDLAMVVR